MNVLLIGSGGREHALAYKINESKQLGKLFISPGNPGTELCGQNVEINLSNRKELVNFCNENKIELIVIGPEVPLVEGAGDVFKEAGFKVFGPNSDAAQIESSKSFAKNLMMKYKIPTASFAEFNSSDFSEALEYCENSEYPLVIKADGLAAGKGVLICNKFSETESALNELLKEKIFGEACSKIIIEEFIEGEEASIFAITDGEEFVLLPSAQDHKRIGDNDTGKNTGGMGAYSPAPLITNDLLKEIEEQIIKPTLAALKKENKIFVGCLYAGLMINKNGIKVVEFNCRFGDPETQAVLPLLKGDFLELLYSAASGKINKNSVEYNGGSSVCVVAASNGYPDKYETGKEIFGLDKTDEDKNIFIFHAGTKKKENKIFSSGGRVLSVVSFINSFNLKIAKQKAYEEMNKINFDGIYFRKDIADNGINFKN